MRIFLDQVILVDQKLCAAAIAAKIGVLEDPSCLSAARQDVVVVVNDYQRCQRDVAENVRVSEDGHGVPRNEKLTEIPTMHKSQLAGFIIDCQTDDIDQAAAFWSAALGLNAEVDPDPLEAAYRHLETRPEEVYIEVQKVDHASRVHLDIETDDIEAEVARLEDLGARRIADIRSWVVMEAPTGQRFCVIRPQRANFDQAAKHWD